MDHPALIKQRINDAFSKPRYPGDGNIVRGGFDGSDPERTKFYRAYKGVKWMDVPEETIRQWPEFSYFSAAGFLYYLPKLMFVALNHRLDPSFTEVIESLFYALTITGKYDEKQRLNFDTLSIPQNTASHNF